jgi:hypothetical protein
MESNAKIRVPTLAELIARGIEARKRMAAVLEEIAEIEREMHRAQKVPPVPREPS